MAAFEDVSKMPKIQNAEIISTRRLSNSLTDFDPIRRRPVRRNAISLADGFPYQNNSTGCQQIATPLTAAVRSQSNDDDDVLSLPVPSAPVHHEDAPSAPVHHEDAPSETEEEFPFAHLSRDLFRDNIYEIDDDDSMSFFSEDSISMFKRVHSCVDEGDDPFVGLVGENLLKKNCCPLQAYVTNETNEPLTVFGSKVFLMCEWRGEDGDDFRRNLRNHLTWGDSGVKDFIADAFFIDSDNVKWRFSDCSICFDFRFVREPPCCTSSICYKCWQSYVEVQSQSLSVALTGTYQLTCFNCNKLVPYPQALSSLERDRLESIRPPGLTSCKGARCPTCLKIPPTLLFQSKNSTSKMESKLRKKKGGHPVDCSQCSQRYCGLCGVLDHPKLTCKQLMSNKTMSKWSKQKNMDSEFQVSFFNFNLIF